MRKLLSITTCILFAGLSVTSCKKSDTKIDEDIVVTKPEKRQANTASDTLRRVNKIDRDIERINNAGLKKTTYTYQCDEKITIDYYAQEGTLFKVAIDYGYVGDGHNKREYYYDSGHVIYIYDFYEGGAVCENCEMKTTIKKSYINNNLVIKHLENDVETACNVCKLSDKDLAYTIISAQKTQDFKTLLCN